MQHKYLFVLTSPFSGSTLLVALLGTSDKVSIFQSPQHEGLKLPSLHHLFRAYSEGESNAMPWGYLHPIFHRHWDLSKPLLVEKGQYTKDAHSIEHHFPGAHYIVMPRNPYAWCESMGRRRKPGVQGLNTRQMAMTWVRQTAWHIHNIESLDRLLYFTYEDLCDRTDDVLRRLKEFMPELDGLDAARKFEVHSTLGAKRHEIINTNDLALARLKPEDIAEISAVLKKYPEAPGYFGYEIL